ncbi:MAG: hypothetical protein WC004_00545 [Candidatus Absconditabacterales bacterium]
MILPKNSSTKSAKITSKVRKICAGALAAVLLWTIMTKPSAGDFSRLGPSCPHFELPQLYVPRIDKEGNNQIESVFWHQVTDRTYEISLLFKDEDDPYMDRWYDMYRKLNYGRIKDIETFHVELDANNRIAKYLFSGTASGNKGWSAWGSKLHHDLIINNPLSGLHINTRNHMFGAHNANPDLPLDTIALGNDPHIPVFQLDRDGLDDLF